ncbi:hypothetical protein [Mesorhizobium sp. M0052]
MRLGTEGARVSRRGWRQGPEGAHAVRQGALRGDRYHGAVDLRSRVRQVGDNRQQRAGLVIFKPLRLTGAVWLKVLSVDLLGAIYFARKAFAHMTSGGVIVNVLSVRGRDELRMSSYTLRQRPPSCL